MKKCRGCGIELQNIDPNKVGYVVDMEKDYCQRCFRLSHYGDTTHLKTSHVNNKNIYDIYNKYKSGLFIVIVDILDSLILADDDLLDIFKDYNVLLIVNKTDLLPSNIKDSKIDRIFSKQLFDLNKKYPNIKSAILTNKFEDKFNEQFFSCLDDLKAKTVIFAGRANAGKSSLINKILHSNNLTTSMYPGTTLDEVEIDYKGYIFIDTPGLVDVNNYSTHLNSEKYKLSKIDKTIKPQIFQLFEPQTYFYEGLFRVDVKPTDKASISFYINNNNEIHRTRYDNGDLYYEKHYNEFKLRVKPLVINEYNVDDYKLFIIKGLGFIKVNGKCSVRIHSLQDVRIYESEIDL